MAPPNNQYECDQCPKTFAYHRSLMRHKKTHQPKDFRCSQCAYATHRNDALNDHIKSKHRTANIPKNGQQELIGDLRDQLQQMRARIDELESIKPKKRKRAEPRSGGNKKARFEVHDPGQPSTSAPSPPNSPPPSRIVPYSDSSDDEGEQTGPNQWRAKDFIQISRLSHKESKRLKTGQSEFKVLIDPKAFDTEVIDRENFESYQDRLTALIQKVLDEIRKGAPKYARGWLAIDFEGLKDKRQKWCRFVNSRFGDIHEIDAKDIMFEVARTLNSNESVKIRNGFKIFINFTETVGGGSRDGLIGAFEDRTVFDGNQFRSKKRSLIDVANDAPPGDQMCCARSIVLGRFIADQSVEKYWSVKAHRSLRDSRRALQGKKAIELHRLAEVQTDRRCTLTEVAKFQAVLPDYQIVVYSPQGNGTEIIYPANPKSIKKDKRIYLWLHEEHFSLINPYKLSGLLGSDYFCKICHQSWNRDPKHLCSSSICTLCRLPKCENSDSAPATPPIQCQACNRFWSTEKCKKAHEERVCQREAKCLRCLSLVPRKKLAPEEHSCMLNKCYFCGEFKPPGHTKCHIQKPKTNVPEEESLLDEESEEGVLDLLGGNETEEQAEEEGVQQRKNIFYADIESEQDPDTHQHFPVLLVVKNEMGTKTWVYWSREEECLDQFVKDLLENDDFKSSVICFHNFAGYDGLFILDAFHKHNLNPNAIFRSSKVLTMQLKKRKVSFLDTYLHTNMPLNRLPGAYAFQDKATKGYFPIFFATKERRGYRGPFVDKKYFDPDNMSKDKFAVFNRWYEAEAQKYRDDPTLQYDLDAEMLHYCTTDVEVLRLGFNAYRRTYMELYKGIDPINFITIPSYISHCYRALGMKEETLAILPPRGYSSDSHIATAWLQYEAMRRKINILHSRLSPEIKIGPYYVDGFHDPQIEGQPKTVFEFQGCYYHGCNTCFTDRRAVSSGSSFEQKYQATKEKINFLRQKGYEVASIFECELRAQMKRDEHLKRFIKEATSHYAKYSPLSPRDSLRGGRTGALRLSYTPKEGERILYMDFTSLYPSINMCVHPGLEYPVSHPDIYINAPFPPIEQFCGLIKAEIDPPRQLFLPILPTFIEGKVIFGLCNQCMTEGNNKTKCTHSVEERRISGTFASPEIHKSLELGYKIHKIIELWNWPSERRSKDLFTDFLKTSYAEKVQSSGWPSSCKTEQDKRDYIDLYKNEQNIDIDYDKVYPNKAKRENSKFCINKY